MTISLNPLRGVREAENSHVETPLTYALRVAGLSKAGATALCVRVKGGDCSIAK